MIEYEKISKISIKKATDTKKFELTIKPSLCILMQRKCFRFVIYVYVIVLLYTKTW